MKFAIGVFSTSSPHSQYPSDRLGGSFRFVTQISLRLRIESDRGKNLCRQWPSEGRTFFMRECESTDSTTKAEAGPIIFSNFFLRTSFFKLLSSNFFLQTSFFKLLSSNFFLQTSFFKLLSSNFFLRSFSK